MVHDRKQLCRSRVRRTGGRPLFLPEIGQIRNGQRVASLLGGTHDFGRLLLKLLPTAARLQTRRCGRVAPSAAIRFARIATRTAARHIGRGAGGARRVGGVLVRALLARRPATGPMEFGGVRLATRSHRFDARIGAGLAALAQRWRMAAAGGARGRDVRRLAAIVRGGVGGAGGGVGAAPRQTARQIGERFAPIERRFLGALGAVAAAAPLAQDVGQLGERAAPATLRACGN